MSSYHGEVGAWDGGPPGAEADYAPQPGPPHAAPLPTTDPWTGVSYSQYGQPQYDYQGYGGPGYGYNYDQSYYSRTDSGYYDNNSRSAYPPQQQETYDYQDRPYEHSRSIASRHSDRRKRSYNSRSVSPYERREREYSRNREASYENARRRRSRSVSKGKRSKYSSSNRSSSRSRSYSRLSIKKEKRSRSASSDSYESRRSSRKAKPCKDKLSLTPPLKKKSLRSQRSRSGTRESRDSYKAKSPKIKREVESKEKAIMKETKTKDIKHREISTPPRKSNVQRVRRKSDRSVTPPKSYKKGEKSPSKKSKYKDPKLPSRKSKHGSLTPPRCYARSRSLSRSPSSSFTPEKRKKSPKPRKNRSSSSSSRYSRSSDRSRSKSQHARHKLQSKDRSHSKSRSRGRSIRRSRSRSSGHSRYREKRSRSSKGSHSESQSSRSRSRSSGSEDDRRGQFTVADRKRFWKMHRQGQEQRKRRIKTPPKEVKPPPGAIESTNVDDIEYGDPPEVEGPNFADLLPPPDQAFQATTSKSKTVALPIKNDGSFLEMFKKMQEATKKVEENVKKPEIKKPILPFIGKRRGGRVLKTGLVKKAKAIDEQTIDNTPKDAWSLYMQEVKKYRETSCEEERKTRPLVK